MKISISSVRSLFKDKPNWKHPVYDLREEIAASATHGIGVFLSITGLIFLIVLAAAYGDTILMAGYIIFGASLTILYLSSTIYHGVQQPRIKYWLRRLDHAAIYVFIAGTYTPFLLVSIQGQTGRLLLALVWSMAIAGIVWKLFFLGRLEVLATMFYVAMGWMALFAIQDMIANIPTTGLVLLVVGGLAYTVGVIFYVWDRVPYNHVIWHLFVMAGSISHFFAVTTLVSA